MEDKRTYYLLSQYIARSINSDELSELKARVNISVDEELLRVLNPIWENYALKESINTTDLHDISTAIKKSTYPYYIRKLINRTLKIAAILLIPLLCSLSVYLYVEKERSNTFQQNDVIVQVEKGQKAGVTLPDGTIVRLNAGSTLRYQQSFGREIRKVSLTGEAFFDVVKNPGKKFVVYTEFLDIEVLGTTFNVYTYENENIVEMTLLTGSIKVNTHTIPIRTTYVKPNEKILYQKNTGTLIIEKTNTRFETAWLRGELVFRSEKIKDVLAKIERRYGVAIHNQDVLIEDDLFTGTFDNDKIVDVMNILKKHYQFDYKQKGEEIWIVGKNRK